MLLLDEPFAALDEITRRQLADDLLALWAEQRPAIVFVTHNVEEAVSLADRVIVLRAGAIVADVDVRATRPRLTSDDDVRSAATDIRTALHNGNRVAA